MAAQAQALSSPSASTAKMLPVHASVSDDAETSNDAVMLASPSAIAASPRSYPNKETSTAANDGSSKEKDAHSGKELVPAATNSAAAKYLQLQHRLREHWKDCPDLYIHYNNLHYTLRVPVVEISTPSFLRAGAALIFRLVKALDVTGYLKKNDRTLDLHALAACNGRIAPGLMTLVLAPPGHGKSTYLKALAGRLNRDSKLQGAITYNGLTAAQVRQRGVVLPKLAMYVGQTDMHFPTLTVKETLSFAAQNSCASTEPFGDAVLDQMESERAERLIHMIGLEEATNTIIGNDLLRGVSGGQRKRVTLGEMLITNSRAFFLDEVSTGLDSAITFHIFNALRSYCHECRNSVVTALLQPTPETYGLFDEVVLLRDGEVVYHGPREGVRPFFSEQLGFPIPDDEDEAGFVVDYLTNPTLLMENQRRKRERAQRMAEYAAGREVSRSGKHRDSDEEKHTHDSTQVASVTHRDDESTEHSTVKPTYAPSANTNSYSHSKVAPALETADMAQRFRQSTYYRELMMDAEASQQLVQSDSRYSLDPTHWSSFSQQQYAQPFPHTWPRHFHMAVTRQGKLFWRNKQVLIPRIFQAVLMGIVYGTLFYKLNIGDYQSKMGLLMYLTMFGAFANLSELPVAAEARAVVTKQLDSSFYPTLPYIFSVIFLSLPLLVVETFIFGTLMYWLPGFVPDAGRFFFWLLVLFCGSLALSTFFRTISYVTPNPDVARQLDFPFIHPVRHLWRLPHPLQRDPALAGVDLLDLPAVVGRALAGSERVQELALRLRRSLNDQPGQRAGRLLPGHQFDVSPPTTQYKWSGRGLPARLLLHVGRLVSSVCHYLHPRRRTRWARSACRSVDAKAAAGRRACRWLMGRIVNSSRDSQCSRRGTDTVASGCGQCGLLHAGFSTVGAPMGSGHHHQLTAWPPRNPLTVPTQVGGSHVSVPISVCSPRCARSGKSFVPDERHAVHARHAGLEATSTTGWTWARQQEQGHQALC